MEIQLKFSDPRNISFGKTKNYIELNFSQSLTSVTNTTVITNQSAISTNILKPLTGAVENVLATTTVLT